MKSLVVFLTVMVLCPLPARSQFKAQETHSVSGGIMRSDDSGTLLGFFNPNQFQMHHSFSLSYQTMGGQGLSLGTYTNSMMYNLDTNLRARADISMSFSPYNNVTGFGNKNLSSIYLSRAEIDYEPWKNFNVYMRYRNSPYGYYSPYYHPWSMEERF